MSDKDHEEDHEAEHHGSGIVDRVIGKAEEIAGVVIYDEQLRVAGELREERGELEAEAHRKEHEADEAAED